MTHFCPAYPQPRKSRASFLLMFFSARRSWLDALYERSYAMQMGEVHLPGLDLYMVNDPTQVRRVMSTEADAFPKSPQMHEALKPLLGESIFTTNGSQWKRQRRMMDPAFTQARVHTAFPVMLAAVQSMLGRLESVADGAEHDLEIEMTHVTADIIFRTIFSQPMEGEDARRIFHAFARYQAMAPRLMVPAMFGMRWFATPWHRWRSLRAAAEIRLVLERLVRPRYDSWHSGQPQDHSDILASFLATRDPGDGKPFGFDELVDQVAMLFLAGHETSASALTWAVYLLAKAPEIQERVHAEVVARMGDRLPAFADVKELPLTWNVFKETLRLFPPVGFIARASSQTCPMRDKVVPKGATVVVAPWLIHRHRELWREPDAFDPDRFAGEGSRESLQQGYLPFGMGPRVCMGAAFALQEAALVLSALVRRFRVEAVAGHTPVPVGRLTIRSANGVRLVLHKRTQG